MSSARRRRCWPACRDCAARSRRDRRSRPSAACTDCPTVVNNTETLANMPFIAARGAEAYAALSPDTETNGSKLVCFNERFVNPTCTRSRSGCRCASCARSVAGGLRGRPRDQGGADRRPARRDPAGLQARHRVRFRRRWRPRAAWSATASIVAFDDQTDMRARRHAICCISARTRAAASASPAGSGCGAPTRCSPSGAPVDAGRFEELLEALELGQPVRPRRRHAGADAQPAGPLPRRTGARVMITVTVDGARARDRRRARRSSRRPSRPAPGCRRCASTSARRRSAPAACAWSASRARRKPLPACTTPCRDGMEIDTHDATVAPGRHRGRRARAVRAAARARGRTPSSAQVADRLERRTDSRWPGVTHHADHDVRHPYLAFQHELCISCGRCVRACDEVQGAFALTATGRGFSANMTAGPRRRFSRLHAASRAAPAPTPARPTRSPRSRCSTASLRHRCQRSGPAAKALPSD